MDDTGLLIGILALGAAVYLASRTGATLYAEIYAHAYPTNQAAAEHDLQYLSALYYQALKHKNTAAAELAHQTAAKIRARYGAFGHPNGYTIAELRQLGYAV